jgi:hypothetical protein
MLMSSQRARRRGAGSRRPRASAAALIPLLLLLVPALPARASWGEIARASDRGFDAVLLEALAGATLDEQLEILEGIGGRADPGIGVFVEEYLLRRDGSPSVREHLLRVLLDAAFPRGTPLAELAPRVAANRDALLAAASRLPTFADPQLRAAVVRVIPLLPEARPHLLALLDGLADLMAAGPVDPRQSGLALDALDAARAIAAPDFLDPVLAIARRSRERVVVERARQVALVLAEAGR